MDKYELRVKTHFAAAHNLREYHGNCEHLHGHNWKIEVILSSSRLNSLGMVLDFREIKKILGKILDELDHKYLNELGTFKEDNPTTENIAGFIFKRLKENISSPVRVEKVIAWESDGCGAAYCEGNS